MKAAVAASAAIAASAALAVLLTVAASAHAIARPNDPLYAHQSAPGGALAVINEPQALREIGQTPLRPIVLSALDTGVDLTHPDLAAQLVTFTKPVSVPGHWGGTAPAGAHGWNFLGDVAQGHYSTLYTTNGGNADPSDPPGHTGHGTAVTGIMAAGFDNGIGPAGIAPNARILAIRSCWDDDGCPGFIEPYAIRFAAQQHARVVTMSWNMDAGGFAPSLSVIKASKRTLFVTLAGGNGGAAQLPPDQSPCQYAATEPNVICVSTSSSSDGLDCGGYSSTLVDLAVPTENNWTTVNGGGYAPTGCATSYASPTLGGGAAMLFGLDPTATPAQVKSALIDSARRASAWSGKSVSGGVLDLAAAVKLFAQRRGIALTSRRRESLGLRISTRRFRRRARLTLTLAQPGTVTLQIIGTGPKHHVLATIGLRHLPAGTSSRRFIPRLHHGALPRGRYLLRAVATGTHGSRSSAVRLRFRIL